jgi:hypothetical protein
VNKNGLDVMKDFQKRNK